MASTSSRTDLDISCRGVKDTETWHEYPSMSMMQPIVSSAGKRIYARKLGLGLHSSDRL